MKNSYTGEQFNFIRLFLVSRQCVKRDYDRYASGFYFNTRVVRNGLAVFQEVIIKKQTRMLHVCDLYFSKKDFDYLIGRVK